MHDRVVPQQVYFVPVHDRVVQGTKVFRNVGTGTVPAATLQCHATVVVGPEAAMAGANKSKKKSLKMHFNL